MAISEFKFAHRLRVRYSEVDPQAVVFHARYLDYADVAITEYWREFDLSVVSVPGQPEFQLVSANVSYKAAIRLDEEIALFVRTASIGRTSITTVVEMHGIVGEDLRARVEEVHVNVDLASGKPQLVPLSLVERMQAFEGGPLVRQPQ